MVFMFAAVQELLVDVLIGTFEVGFEAAWWLQGHLGAVLEDGHWEVVCGH
jgi:hypothetical protein